MSTIQFFLLIEGIGILLVLIVFISSHKAKIKMGKEWEEWLEKEETDGALAHRTYTALKIFAIYLVFAGIVGIGAVLTSQEEPWTWAIFGSMVIEIIFLYFWKIVPILKE